MLGIGQGSLSEVAGFSKNLVRVRDRYLVVVEEAAVVVVPSQYLTVLPPFSGCTGGVHMDNIERVRDS